MVDVDGTCAREGTEGAVWVAGEGVNGTRVEVCEEGAGTEELRGGASGGWEAAGSYKAVDWERGGKIEPVKCIVYSYISVVTGLQKA